MDRAAALRVLGLDERASEADRVAAYWRVRAHVETRLEDAADEGLRARRHTELEDLKRAVELLAGEQVPHGSTPFSERRGIAAPPARWLVAWSVLATVLVGALAASLIYVLTDGVAPSGEEAPVLEPSPSSLTEPLPAAPGEASALLVVTNLPDARLAVESLESGELVAAGPADGTSLSLEPGGYRLRVEHPDCSDPWTRELFLEAGDSRGLVATSCADLGWLVVRSNVSGDSLEIDGEEIGATGPSRHHLSSGEHRIRVTGEGYVPWEGLVSVPAAQELTLHAILQSESGAGQSQTQQQRQQAAAPQAAEAAGEGRDPGDLPMAPPEWLERATHYLLSRYDFDRSGSLDTLEEVEAIPCNDWLAFERSLDASQLGVPLTRLYGFDGGNWVDGAFGIEGGLRHASYLHMKECGLR